MGEREAADEEDEVDGKDNGVSVVVFGAVADVVLRGSADSPCVKGTVEGPGKVGAETGHSAQDLEKVGLDLEEEGNQPDGREDKEIHQCVLNLVRHIRGIKNVGVVHIEENKILEDNGNQHRRSHNVVSPCLLEVHGILPPSRAASDAATRISARLDKVCGSHKLSSPGSVR